MTKPNVTIIEFIIAQLDNIQFDYKQIEVLKETESKDSAVLKALEGNLKAKEETLKGYEEGNRVEWLLATDENSPYVQNYRKKEANTMKR